MRLTSSAIIAIVAASASLPAYAVSFKRDHTFADLQDRSLGDLGRRIKDYLRDHPLPLGPGPVLGPAIPTGPTSVSGASGDPITTAPPSRRGLETRRSKSRPKSSSPPPKSGSGIGSTITSVLNHPSLPGLVDGVGTLAGTIIAAKQQHDQNELLKQQLALQQAQAQAAAAQAQLPPVDPSATPTSSVDPSQTSAPPQRRDTRALEARSKIANLATLADHVNHGLNAAMNAYNQAQMMTGGGFGVGFPNAGPGFATPPTTGGIGVPYSRGYDDLEESLVRSFEDVLSRDVYGNLNDLD